MNPLNLAETSVLVALAERAILERALDFCISTPNLLLSACLRDDQIDLLEHTFAQLQQEGYIASWSRSDTSVAITLTMDFPIPNIGPLEREKLSDTWLKRVLLSKLYLLYKAGQHRFTHYPLATLSGELGVSREDIFKAVTYLNDEYYLEYAVCDGGNCTSDITNQGIAICDNRAELFEHFSIIHVSTKPVEEEPASTADGGYVALSRLEELKLLKSDEFDFARLIEMCRELNVAHSGRSHMAIAMLVRAILDHVPPVFGCRTFSEVANNYSGGRSFSQLAKRLQETARVIADMNLHNPIGVKEPLPSFQQVNCASELDCLLAEIVRVVSGRKRSA